MNEAQDDDYIYLPGITFTNDSLTFKHRVNVVGAGYYPDSSKYVGRTILSSCNAYLCAGAAGGSIQGVNLDPYGTIVSKHCTSFTVSKCMFSGAQIEDSVRTFFDSSSLSYNPNYYTNYNGFLYVNDCIVTNNLSNNSQYAAKNCYFTVNANNSIINNDYQFMYGGSSVTNCVILYASYVGGNVYRNCIIAVRAFNLSCTYYNCHFMNFTTQTLSGLASGATLINCTSATNTTDTFVGGACPTTFPTSNSYAFDFHVKSSSTAAASGLDGTDKGIYGTTSPYDPTPYPHIYYKVIAPTTDAQGQLQINVKAKAQ
jgi:hypothetical protein